MSAPPVGRWTEAELRQALADEGAMLRRLCAAHGSPVPVEVEQRLTLFAFWPEHTRQVLSQPDLFHLGADDSPAFRPEYAGTAVARLGGGLLAMRGERHRERRRRLSPAFAKEHVAALAPSIAAETVRHVASWAAGEVRDLLAEMSQLGARLTLRQLSGLDATGEGRTLAHLVQVYTVGLFADLPPADLLPRAEAAEDALLALIASRTGEAGNPAGTTDTLSALASGGLPPSEIAAHLTTLFIAGHLSTAGAAAWTLLVLAQHPEAREPVLREVDALETAATAAGGAAPLLEGAVRETLRLHPPGTWGRRVAARACQVGEVRLPAGTEVYFSPAVTHRLPRLYPEPDRFLPLRWLTLRPSPYAYLPFSAGPRKCIGSDLALLQIKVVVAAVLRRWRLELPAGFVPQRGRRDPRWPQHDMPLEVHPR